MCNRAIILHTITSRSHNNNNNNNDDDNNFYKMFLKVMQIDAPLSGGNAPNWKPKPPIPSPRRSVSRGSSSNNSRGAGAAIHDVATDDHVSDLRRRVLERLDAEGLSDEITLDLTRASGNYDEVHIADGEVIQTAADHDQSTLIEGTTVEGGYDGAGHRLPPPPFEWSGGSSAAKDAARPKSIETDDGFCPPPRDSILNSAPIGGGRMGGGGGGRGGPRDSMMELINDLNDASSTPTDLGSGTGAGSAAVNYRNAGSDGGRQRSKERVVSRYDGFDDDFAVPGGRGHGGHGGGVIPEEDDDDDGDDGNAGGGGGGDSDSDDEFAGFGDSFTPPTTAGSATNNSSQPEFGIPATDQSLRQTVEDLVEDSLRRQGGSAGRHSINSDNDSVSSGVSAEAISHIVAETVNRLMKDKYAMGGGGGSDSGHRHSGGSDQYLPADSPRNSRSRYSGGSYDSGSASAASWSDGGATDPEYIAGDQTMDQLRIAKPPSAKAVARGRIRRLKTGQGKNHRGVCMCVSLWVAAFVWGVLFESFSFVG